ncbi:MAG: outer membrane beta-barrel protein [Rikenellaceae bacterium]
MKKIYLLLLSLLFAVVGSAQGIAHSWWGVRGGVSFSNISSPDYSTRYLTGYGLGVSYSHPVSRFIPVYIESGLYFQQRGARDNGFLTENGGDSSLTKRELEVPLVLGYHLELTRDWSIQSFVGLYYAVAVDGVFRIGDGEFDPYRKEMLQTLRDSEPTEQQLLHRSDFGLRVGVSVLYHDFVLGFAFDGGVTNLYTAELRDEGFNAHAGSFMIQMGYNF